MINIIKKILFKKKTINLSYKDNFAKLRGVSKKELIRLCIRQSEQIELMKKK